MTEKEKEKATVQLGQNSCSAAGLEGKRPRRASARVRFSDLTGGARASGRERGARER